MRAKTKRVAEVSVLTVENWTGEVAEELLEKVGLLARDFVEAIALAALLDVVRGETGAELRVEDCRKLLASAGVKMACGVCFAVCGE